MNMIHGIMVITELVETFNKKMNLNWFDFISLVSNLLGLTLRFFYNYKN